MNKKSPKKGIANSTNKKKIGSAPYCFPLWAQHWKIHNMTATLPTMAPNVGQLY
jgi:hypothetical protein